MEFPPGQKLSEHQEQSMFFDWLQVKARGEMADAEWGYAVPNGHGVHVVTRMKMKEEGVKTGVPDVEFAASRRGFTGLHLEFKRADGGTVSDEQKKWLAALRKLGRCCVVVYGREQAEQVTLWYFTNAKWPWTQEECQEPKPERKRK